MTFGPPCICLSLSQLQSLTHNGGVKWKYKYSYSKSLQQNSDSQQQKEKFRKLIIEEDVSEWMMINVISEGIDIFTKEKAN